MCCVPAVLLPQASYPTQWCPPGVVDAEVLPLVCLVGKGVCFDSGGLDIKSAQGMKLMKKVGGRGAGGCSFFGEVGGSRLVVVEGEGGCWVSVAG